MDILIVDDSSDSRALLASLLKKSGYQAIMLAESAQDSFEILYDANNSVSLILMDIMMPGMDGLEACRRIKSDKKFTDIPVIMVTAKTDEKSLQTAIDAGAMDYITKPFNKVELLARVKSALTLKREMDIRKERERQIARIGHEIQKTLLSGEPPDDIPGVTVAALTLPSQKIDGDFYDFIKYNDEVFDVIVADVMGKGIPAAMFGAATKNQLLRAVNQIIIGSKNNELPEPEEVVNRIHSEITEELIRLESFVTLFYFRLNMQSKNICFVNCGHTSTLHFKHDSGKCIRLEGDNMPLGFSEGEIYRQRSAPFKEGDLFLFYSDGITEANNGRGELFGIERLEQCVEDHYNLEPEELIEGVRKRVTAFSERNTFSDDITCVVVKVKEIHRGELEINKSLSNVATVRNFIEKMCARHTSATLDDRYIFELKLAVHETLVNIIQHGSGKEDDKSIKIEVVLFQDKVTVYLCYRGKAFSPESVSLSQVDSLKEHGYGMFITKQMTDRVTYSVDKWGQNCIRLEKKVKK